MRRLGFLVRLLAIGAFAALPAPAQGSKRAPLRAPPQSSIERAIAAAEALGARTGVAVVDAVGKIRYRHRATETFVPASNMKLLTATASLQGLGADFRFTTRFRLRAGKLVVEASGDPNWRAGTVHDPAVVFATVAAELARLGVRNLAGIELEAGTFVGPNRPPSWPQDQLQTYYCAPTGGFVLESGTFSVRIRSGGGAAAEVEIAAPPVDLPIRNSIELVDRSKGAVYGAIDLGDAVQVRGRFPRKGNPVTIRTAVDDPTRWYERALHKQLLQAGITIGSDPGGQRGEPSPVADRLVHEHHSDLRQVILRMLEDSSNFDAEQCLRVLGHRTRDDGRLTGGLDALRQQLVALVGGVPQDAVFADGSGLSKDNRLTPGLLVVALVRSHTGPAGAVLRSCLPIAGQTGTLSDRFVGTDLVGRVRAKTGWVRGASSLSGMVEGKDGQLRWFSILMNYDPKKDGLNKDLKRLQEDIVQAIEAMGTGG
jgi:D-alanyl-D-alanine carboxypeptidase/D-alanyl-D-alanine-endopeptidase (penicillin-binding protein 4)